MNGTFKVTLDTPIGRKSGTITFIDDGRSLGGTIRAMGHTNHFTGRADGNSFDISGVLHVGFLNFQYTAQGTVNGNALNGSARSSAGNFQMSGTRVS